MRPASVCLLMTGLLFQGLSGVVGGIALVMDPSGRVMQIPVRWLDGSPFDDYRIPGLILLLALGAFPLVVLYGVRGRFRWAWLASLLVGVGLIVWIGVQILIIGYHPRPPLQLIYGSLGVAIVVLALCPPVRRYFEGDARGSPG